MSITKPLFTANNVTNILNCSVVESHSNTCAIATIEAMETDLIVGDLVEVYATANSLVAGSSLRIFSGYVKQLERKTPSTTVIITANDRMIRAVDYFIASTNPDASYKRSKIAAETLVGDLLAMAGLTATDLQTTYFVLANTGEIEVKLTSSYDFSKTIADLIAWSLWCDRDGVIHFRNRKPFIMYGTSGQPGDVADTIQTTGSLINGSTILDAQYSRDEKDLRNRIVVYGANGYAEAAMVSPYLPDGFYKTAIVGAQQMLSTSAECQLAANYNLNLYNKLTERSTLTIIGNPTFQARMAINIASVTQLGGVLNTDWYIYSCEHTYSVAGYTTTLELRK